MNRAIDSAANMPHFLAPGNMNPDLNAAETNVRSLGIPLAEVVASGHRLNRVLHIGSISQRRSGSGDNAVLFDAMCAEAMGRALSRTLSAALEAPNATIAAQWLTRLAAEFLKESNTHRDYYISPESFANLRSPYREPAPANSWSRNVESQLLLSVEAVFRGREPPNAAVATAIRLASLCLAAEPYWDDSERPDMYRRLAAGITFLERRANGQSPANEHLFLAVE
jgi:hypothetical protein